MTNTKFVGGHNGYSVQANLDTGILLVRNDEGVMVEIWLTNDAGSWQCIYSGV